MTQVLSHRLDGHSGAFSGSDTPLQIDAAALLRTHYSPFRRWPAWVQFLVGRSLALLIRQDRINHFLADNSALTPFDFIDRVFDELSLRYEHSPQDIENIPARGGVIIFANHPLGALDGLALLHLVARVRRDVKIVANQLLEAVTPLAPLLLPVDNMRGETRKADFARITDALAAEQAVIFFPAGEVSRLSASGVRDSRWDAGFLRFAERLNMPVMPVLVQARNSGLFYLAGRISAVLSMLLLPHEMIRFRGQLRFITGAAIEPDQLHALALDRRQKARLLRKHLYRLASGKAPVIPTRAALIHPQDRQLLKAELARAEPLGMTADRKKILLLAAGPDSAVLDELGRLREQAFRAVGEGTGRNKDIDSFDSYYRHIIVWDEDRLEIAGAYRIGEIWRWPGHSVDRLYSASLFEYEDDAASVCAQGLELGRSFVQPQFWGKRSLDYLWQGIGAYVACHSDVRYLFGPVSLSASLPVLARNMLVWHYSHYYQERLLNVRARRPFRLNSADRQQMRRLFSGTDCAADFTLMREQLGHMQIKVPTLFRQYSEVCQPGGISFSGFNIDRDFSFCLDSLVCVDLHKLKLAKYERYIQPCLAQKNNSRPPVGSS